MQLEPSELDRFKIRRELGRGWTGVVYEALDTKDRALVALKTIDPRAAESLYRLKHEFRALADVQHPNLVRCGELMCREGRWFFTMELVRGADFASYVRGGPSALGLGFDEARLRAALAQLVDALSAIHEAGQVHCDIKPSNVLVSETGHLVVLDFGLAALSEVRAPVQHDGRSVGTPEYMAPEQIEGRPPRPAVDWYALGVMLYEALTGSLPFDGLAHELLQAKLRGEPEPARTRVRGVPSDLDALCTALLRRDPAERPDAAAIRAQLGLSAPESEARSTPSSLAPPPFVGREEELALLGRALDQVAHSGARTIVIEGEAGIGKSSLVHEFARRFGRGTVFLSGRCYEQEAVPFRGVDAMIDSLSDWLMSLPASQLKTVLAGRGVRYLSAVFPVLARVPVIAAERFHGRTVPASPALRDQACAELEALLSALSQHRPVVVFIDDLQWIDRDSLTLLECALRGATRLPCLLIATVRKGELARLAGAALFEGAERVPLGPLSEAESLALAEMLRPGSVEPERERAELVAESRGHPLFLGELVQSLRAGGTPRPVAGQLEHALW